MLANNMLGRVVILEPFGKGNSQLENSKWQDKSFLYRMLLHRGNHFLQLCDYL